MTSLEEALGFIPSALIAVLSFPSVVRLAKIKSKVIKPASGTYEDKDGVASEESMAKFSTTLPFVFIYIATAVGIAASFALSVYATDQKGLYFWHKRLLTTWLSFPAWVSVIQELTF